MDRLRCIEVFLEVAKGLSFSAAAQRLGMANGNVTKHVAWLERSLGVQLLLRTTKSVNLTESGLALLENGRELLDRVDSVEAAVRLTAENPKGTLRVGAPPSFASSHLVPAIAEYSKRHPDVRTVLYNDDGRGDLVAEALDMSIRIVPTLKDTSQVAHQLAVITQVLVASPDYVRTRGMPKDVQDLANHNCMVNSLKSPTNHWAFDGPFGKASVRVTGTVRADFGEPLRHAALLGMGIAMHPHYMVSDDLRTGKLRVVLEHTSPQSLQMYAVFSSRKSMTPRVRTLLEFMQVWYSNDLWWLAGG